jgi:dihydrodipicolinate synthase/N-acetylneuraminate lyase
MNLAGVFSPIPTPFDDRDRVDTVRLKAALAKWVTKPLNGFVVLGSNGKLALMDDFECDQAIVAARDAVPRDKVFIVGTGRESTQGAVRRPSGRPNMAPTRSWCAHPASSRAR